LPRSVVSAIVNQLNPFSRRGAVAQRNPTPAVIPACPESDALNSPAPEFACGTGRGAGEMRRKGKATIEP